MRALPAPFAVYIRISERDVSIVIDYPYPALETLFKVSKINLQIRSLLLVSMDVWVIFVVNKLIN